MDVVNNALGRKPKNHHDAERGSSETGPLQEFTSGSYGTLLPSSTDQLTAYRFLVGITTNPTLRKTKSMFKTGSRAASNIGIYAHVVENEKAAGKAFIVYAVLINACLGLQIIVAAALTALGASSSTNGAVTYLGAINTVIAGFLTFLKGSGLPNRLQYEENEWAKLREFIEQQERAFSREGCPLDVYKVVEAIEKMYAEIKADVESNQPDSYISVSQLKKGNSPPPLGLGSEQFVVTPAKDGTADHAAEAQQSSAATTEAVAGAKAESTGSKKKTGANPSPSSKDMQELLQGQQTQTAQEASSKGAAAPGPSVPK